MPTFPWRLVALETVRAEVEAWVVIARKVEVARVVVERIIVKLVMVEVLLLVKIPPERVARPLAETVPMLVKLPEESRRAVPPVERVPMLAVLVTLKPPAEVTERPPELIVIPPPWKVEVAFTVRV